ncbi:hypothetical protein LguiB_009932 [Lonicera macranthoides]
MTTPKDQLLARLQELQIDFAKYDHPVALTVEDQAKYVGHMKGALSVNLFLKDKKHRYYIVSALTDTKVDLKGTVHFPLSGPLGSIWFVLWMFHRILNSGSFKIPSLVGVLEKNPGFPRKENSLHPFPFPYSFFFGGGGGPEKNPRFLGKENSLHPFPHSMGEKLRGLLRILSHFFIFDKITPILTNNYLGLPLGGNPGSVSFWDLVIERVAKRLEWWHKGCLSTRGRLVLIQSVLESIPIYFLSIFKIPTQPALRLEKLMRDFFWEGKGEGKRDHLVKWEMVTKSKKHGGLGLGSIINRNLALLGKWLGSFHWKEALWHTIIVSKYGLHPNGGGGGGC